MKDLNLSLFDLIMAAVVLAGIMRGRKRGMSHELLDMMEWLAIVVAAGLGYRALGGLLVRHASLPAGIANLIGYMLVAAVVALIFQSIKRAVGEKLVQGDAFGRLEFYLGMVGGAVRFSCMALFVLALLHAKFTTPAERAAFAQMQKDNLGSISFPTLAEIRESVFKNSISGKFVADKLSPLLIQPARQGPQTESIGRSRERVFNEAGK